MERGVRNPGCRSSLHSTHQSVEHNAANEICLGARIVGEWLVLNLYVHI
jgi:ribose 5-phosphate isomerase RpiB